LEVEVLSLHLKILYVAPAVLIASLARVIRLHNSISSLFGIRARFDLDCILIPLCGSVGIAVDRAFREKLIINRRRAMERTFYAYASFEDPKISKELVLGAIDLWTWYWILLETLVLLVLADTVFFLARSYSASSFVSLSLLAGTLLFLTCYRICGSKADVQIEQITSDAQRANSVRAEFLGLH